LQGEKIKLFSRVSIEPRLLYRTRLTPHHCVVKLLNLLDLEEKKLRWYTLTPFDSLTFQDAQLVSSGEKTWISGNFPPNGHTIAKALREVLQGAIVTLRGPFFCREDALYFPCPFSYTQQLHTPVTWIQEQTATGALSQLMLWDRRKPVPLMSGSQLDDLNVNTVSEPAIELKNHQQFLSYDTVLNLLKGYSLAQGNRQGDRQGDRPDDHQCASEEHPLPWSMKTQSAKALTLNSSDSNRDGIEQVIWLNEGWKLAVALDQTTHKKLENLGHRVTIYLGENRHPFWLESHNRPFSQQWQTLQVQSEQNRQAAERLMAQRSKQSRSLAYLVTLGVFERKNANVSTCRNVPWEWDLAHSLDRNHKQGPLVSVATTDPVLTRCCSLSTASGKGDLSLQVSAVAAGSVYYLEYPAALFQNQPFLKNGRSNKAHIWRQLGYSEIFWLPCAFQDH
jgi:CRISPR-associated protein Cmr3